MAFTFEFSVIGKDGETVFKAKSKDPVTALVAGAGCLKMGIGCEFIFLVGGMDGFLDIEVDTYGEIQFGAFDGNGDGLTSRQEEKLLKAFDCPAGREAIKVLTEVRKVTLAR